MAVLTKKYFFNLDLVRNAISNFKIHPLNSQQRVALGNELTTADAGLTVYDTDINALFSWTGTAWDSDILSVNGLSTSNVQLDLSFNDGILSLTGSSTTVDLDSRYVVVGSIPTPTLQSVTSAGNTTNNHIFLNNGAGLVSHFLELTNFSGDGGDILFTQNVTYTNSSNHALISRKNNSIAIRSGGAFNADKFAVLNTGNLSALRTFNFPNASGTLALVNDITVPTLQQVTNVGNSSSNVIKVTNANNVGSGNFGYLGFQATSLEGIVGSRRTGAASSAEMRSNVSAADNVRFTFSKNTGGTLDTLATIERSDGNVAIFDGTVSGDDPINPQDFITLNYFENNTPIPTLQSVTEAGAITNQQVTFSSLLTTSSGIQMPGISGHINFSTGTNSFTGSSNSVVVSRRNNNLAIRTASGTLPSLSAFANLSTVQLTEERIFAFPDNSGTLALISDLSEYIPISQIGVTNGVASLDSQGTVPISQLPDSIFGQMHFGGTYNGVAITASSDYPQLEGQPLPAAADYKGIYFISTASYSEGGEDYLTGDWIVSTGVQWTKVDNTDAVSTVFGRTGPILAVEGDYAAFYPRLSQTYNNPSWINSLAYSKLTGAPDLSAYLPLAGGTMSGDIEMGSNEIYTNNFFYVRNGSGHTPYVTLANARSGTNEMRLEWGIPYGSGSGYAPFKISLDYDNPSNGLTIQTPSTLSTSSATPKLVFNIGDNIASPNMTVAQFYGSVLGRMPSSVGDGSGYPGDFATKPYVDSQVGNYLPLSAGPSYPLTGDLYGNNARFSGGGSYEVGFAAIESPNNGWHVLPAATGGVAMGYVNNMGYLEAQSSSSFTDGQYRLYLRHSTDAGSLPLFEIASKATYSSEYTLTDPKDLAHKAYVDSATGKMFSYTTSGDGVTTTFSVPHGLSYTPTMVLVTANSRDALGQDAGIGATNGGAFYAYIDGANVVIDYDAFGSGTSVQIPAGTNNLKWTILVR